MFFTNSLNIIDIIAIVPYFVTIMVEVLALAEESNEIDASGSDGSGEGSAIIALDESDDYSTQHYSDKVAFLAVMRIVRLLRIIRLAKLSRHSRNLNALVKESGLNSFSLGYSTGRSLTPFLKSRKLRQNRFFQHTLIRSSAGLSIRDLGSVVSSQKRKVNNFLNPAGKHTYQIR